MGEMDAYRDIFLSESADYIQAITDGLIALESNPGDLEPVETVFRGAHSLKGMSAAMGYDRTSDLTHKMEGLMDRVRSKTRPVDAQLIDLMLDAVDMVRLLIEDESNEKSTVEAGHLVSRIIAMTDASPDAQLEHTAIEATDADATRAPAGEADADDGGAVLAGPSFQDGKVLQVTATLEESCVLKAVRAYMVIKRLSHMGEIVDTVPTAADIEDERFDREFTVVIATPADEAAVREACLGVSEIETATVSVAHLPEIVERATVREAGSPTEPGVRRRTEIPKLSQTQTVRIAIGHLDTLVNLVGELVVLRSRLEQVATQALNPDLDEAVEDLRRVSGDLQHEVMHTRMVPVGNIFNRFPRMVRDLARDLGKEIDFHMDGLDIELDRTVLDEIGDPIVHLLRNSIDHGIEDSASREAAGKPAKGAVTLVAVRERDQVRIRVSDDGRGIDCGRVWERAVDAGLVSASDRDSYAEDKILLFTCTPGFTTKDEATKISGRGVGMDAVKGKVEYLGGTMRIESTPGQGMSVDLTLPLTLAIVQSLMLVAEGQMFAIALSSVDEVLGPDEVRLDTVDGAPVVLHRDGAVLPLFTLSVLLGMDKGPHRMPRTGDHIVVVSSAGVRRALLVDELKGRREIVIKPMSRLFSNARGLAGATVLGDGTVALIIDTRTVFPTQEES